MTQYVAIAILSIVVMELLLRLPILNLSSRVLKLSQRALHIIRMKTASDHRKEQVLPVYAARMAWCTTLIAGYMLLIGAAAWCGPNILDLALAPDEPTVGIVASWQGLTASLLGPTAYIALRGLLG